MKKCKEGFTIVEVLIASIIIFLGFLAGSVFFYTNRKNLYNARLEKYATWSAIEKIEEIKGKNNIEEGEIKENILLGEHNMPAERVVNIIESEQDELIWKVIVKVKWGQNKEVSLYTYLPK